MIVVTVVTIGTIVKEVTEVTLVTFLTVVTVVNKQVFSPQDLFHKKKDSQKTFYSKNMF